MIFKNSKLNNINIEEILTRQCTSIEFKDNKIKYFSLSTQHKEAATLEEALEDIVVSDERFEHKTPYRYALDKVGIRDATPEERQHIQEYIGTISTPTGYNFWDAYSSYACLDCSNNPKNGGSGICHCILGQYIIT